MRTIIPLISLFIAFAIAGCNNSTTPDNTVPEDNIPEVKERSISDKLSDYSEVALKTDLELLDDNEKKVIPILIKAAEIMDKIFWKQCFGDKEKLMNSIEDTDLKKYAEINYGPWDRLDGNKPFIEGYDKQPIGANFYPEDIKYLQFVDMKYEDKFSMYTILRRNTDGSLYTVPYSQAYTTDLEAAASLLREAASITNDKDFANYLQLRANALLSDNYFDSDLALLDLKNNKLEFLIGPVEDIEDRFLNTKTSFEAYMLLKDKDASEKVHKYVSLLPELQKTLPVSEAYKNYEPAVSDMYIYNAIYYAGFCNAGGKTISVNRPRDPRVHMKKGIRNMQFKNIMKHKFEKILQPISKVMIDDEQQQHVKFESFYLNNLFFEIAEGMGMVQTLNNKGTVKEALKSYYNVINTGKADILRLFLISKLHEMGEVKECEIMDNYVTFMADLFRSVRFGTGHPQGKANMIRFYFFQEAGAFTRDNGTGKYHVNFAQMKSAIAELTTRILLIQGDGDYNAAKELVEEKGFIRDELKNDIVRIEEAGIPKDLIFSQGIEVLGL